jgi:hypothetical protein
MNPQQSKTDEDVIKDVDRWLDEQRTLISLGEDPMPPGYKITALKRIATNKVREELEREERKLRLDGESKEHIWDALSNYALNMSRDRLLEKRDKGPQPMDIGGVWGGIDMGGGVGNADNGSQYNHQQGGLNYTKGKGKKGQYAPYKGKGNPKGYGKYGGKGTPKGGGKGYKGSSSYPTTPFYGECDVCHRIGHSKYFCPDMGKGFKGACDICKTIGHPHKVCPKGGGKGKGKLGSVDGGGLNLGGGEEKGKEEEDGGGEQPEGIQFDENQGWGEQSQERGQDPFWEGTGVSGLDPWTMGGQMNNIHQGADQWNPTVDPWTQNEWGQNMYGGWVGSLTYGNNKGETTPDILSVENKGTGGDGGSEWVKVKAVFDSGAVETVTPKRTIGEGKMRATEMSRKGYHYSSADGGEITNLGEGDIEGISEDGIPVKLTAQVGDKINRTLIAARRVVGMGNMVILGADREALKRLSKMDKIEDHMIMDKKSGTLSKIYEEGGLYVYPIWMKKERNPTGESGEIGTLEETGDKTIGGMSGDSGGFWDPF